MITAGFTAAALIAGMGSWVSMTTAGQVTARTGSVVRGAVAGLAGIVTSLLPALLLLLAILTGGPG